MDWLRILTPDMGFSISMDDARKRIRKFSSNYSMVQRDGSLWRYIMDMDCEYFGFLILLAIQTQGTSIFAEDYSFIRNWLHRLAEFNFGNSILQRRRTY